MDDVVKKQNQSFGAMITELYDRRTVFLNHFTYEKVEGLRDESREIPRLF